MTIIKPNTLLAGLLTAVVLAVGASAEQIASRHIYAVDGDTIDIGNQRFRLVGFDTPETYRARCSYEKALGDMATARLREMIRNAGIVDVVVLPGRDRYGRGLARLFVAGSDVRDLLISEGLARPYNGGRRSSWCN